MGALRFDGINDTVTLPTQFTVLLGNTNVVIEFRVAVTSYPASGNRYFTGLLSGSSNEGLCLRQLSGDGALALVLAAVNQADFTSSPGYILNDGALHTYRIERDSGTEIRFYRDGSLFQTKPWVTSSSFSLRIQRFGQGSAATTGILGHDFEYFKIITGGSPSNEEWNANLSGGTGPVLPSVSDSNNGTLVNFPTDNSQWIGFSAAYTVTGTGALTFSGTGAAVQWYVAQGTSSLALSGTGSAWQTPYATGTSAVSFSGAGAAVSDNAYRVSGVSVLNFAGAGVAWQTPYATGTSALVFGGNGAASTDSGSYSVSGIGQLTFGGTSSVWQTSYATGTSTLTLSGRGAAWQTPYATGTSTLTFSGAGRVTSGDQQQYGIVRVPATAVSTKIRRAVAVSTVLRYNVAIN